MFVRAAGCSSRSETGARLNSCEVSLSLSVSLSFILFENYENRRKEKVRWRVGVRNRISISILRRGRAKKKGERNKGEGSNLGVVESCSRNLIPNTKKANFNEIQEIVYGSI